VRTSRLDLFSLTFYMSILDLPSIQVNECQLRELAQECRNVLEISNHPAYLFMRGSELVYVVNSTAENNTRPSLGIVREPQLRHFLTHAANFHRIYKRDKKTTVEDASPPGEAIQDILAMPDKCLLPVLDGLTEAPVVRPDGSVLETPGYDETLRLYYSPGRLKKPKVSLNPTCTDVKNSVALIDEVFHDFQFENQYSAANARALLFTPLIRPVIAPSNVPMFNWDANQAGSGKGLGTDIVSLIHTGALSAVKPAPDAGRNAEEEWKKLLLSILMAGSPITLLDNVEGVMKSPALAAALTASEYTDRLLGHSRMVTVPNRTVFILTGNNIVLGGDLPRRCVWIRLESKTSRPHLRTGFLHPNLRQWVREHRSELLSALLTITSAWYKAGAPKFDSPRLGSFEDWSETIGGILQFAGIDGFLGNSAQLYAQADPSEAQWEAFLLALRSSFTSTRFTVQLVMDRMKLPGLLRNTLPDDVTDESFSPGEQLGNGFAKRLGRAFLAVASKRYGANNIRIDRSDTRHGRATWVINGDFEQ